jgi:hypothetical protein
VQEGVGEQEQKQDGQAGQQIDNCAFISTGYARDRIAVPEIAVGPFAPQRFAATRLPGLKNRDRISP